MRILKCLKYVLCTLCIIISIGVGGMLGIGYGEYKQVIADISIEEQIMAIREEESFVPIELIDQDFLNAIVAVEDHRFYKHGAIDTIGLMRAIATNLVRGELVQGGSTITQQLAKNMYFGSEQTLIRKVAELFVATQLEKNYEKEELLELYVNKIYFGNGCYGIEEASEHFLDKSPGDLSIEEAAMLAGLPQSPSRYAADKKLAEKRQQVVLEAMKDNGYLEIAKP